VITKTAEDIRSDISTEFENKLPNLDISEGAPARDLFIEAPISGQLLNLWNKIIYTAKLHAPHTYSDDIETDDLLNYMSNFNVVPTPATYSSGVVTFYSNAAPTQDITIPSGTVVSTADYNAIEFTIQGTYIMYASIAASYYNATTERWEINCSVKASVSGPTSRAGSGTVTKLVTSISGIAGITNDNAVTGGAEEQTTEEALESVLEKYQGRGLGPTQGLINYIKPYVEAVNVVGANDPEMERDEGLGGALDFYVIGETLTNATDTVPITSTGLNTGLNVNYTSNEIIMENQPVRSVVSLIINDVVISTNYYTLTQDTSMLEKSTSSIDKISITSTGLANGISFDAGDVIEINYIYNSLLTTIEDDLNSTSNYYQNRDYLLREMTSITINTYMEFKEVSGQDFDTVSDTVELDIATYIDSVKNAGTLELADIVGVAKSIPTVDNINLTTVSITPVGGGSQTAEGDILFDNNEYPISGTVTLVRWTG